MDDLSSAPLLPNEIIDLIIEFSTDISTLHALCLTSHNCVHTARKYLYEHITLSSASYSSLHTHFELGGERLSQWCTTLSDLNPHLALYLTACTILDLDDEDDWSVVVIILRSAENLKHFAILNPPSEHIHDLLHGHSFHLTSFTFLSHLEDDVDKLIIQFLGDQLRTLSDLLILGPENEALTSFRTQLSITNPTYSEQSKLKILGGEQTTLEELLPLHPRVREIVWMPTNEQESDNLVLTSTAFRDALSHITSLTLATFPEMLSFRPSLTSLCDCLTALEDLHISGRHYKNEIENSLPKLPHLKSVTVTFYATHLLPFHPNPGPTEHAEVVKQWFTKRSTLRVVSIYFHPGSCRYPSDSWTWTSIGIESGPVNYIHRSFSNQWPIYPSRSQEVADFLLWFAPAEFEWEWDSVSSSNSD